MFTVAIKQYVGRRAVYWRASITLALAAREHYPIATGWVIGGPHATLAPTTFLWILRYGCPRPITRQQYRKLLIPRKRQ